MATSFRPMGSRARCAPEDNADAPQAAHDDTAQNGAKAVQCGVEPLDDVADIDAHGADDHSMTGTMISRDRPGTRIN